MWINLCRVSSQSIGKGMEFARSHQWDRFDEEIRREREWEWEAFYIWYRPKSIKWKCIVRAGMVNTPNNLSTAQTYKRKIIAVWRSESAYKQANAQPNTRRIFIIFAIRMIGLNDFLLFCIIIQKVNFHGSILAPLIPLTLKIINWTLKNGFIALVADISINKRYKSS